MIDLSRYTLSEKAREGSESVLYRGRRNEDGAPVAVKMTRSDFPTARDLARLRREFTILQGAGQRAARNRGRPAHRGAPVLQPAARRDERAPADRARAARAGGAGADRAAAADARHAAGHAGGALHAARGDGERSAPARNGGRAHRHTPRGGPGDGASGYRYDHHRHHGHPPERHRLCAPPHRAIPRARDAVTPVGSARRQARWESNASDGCYRQREAARRSRIGCGVQPSRWRSPAAACHHPGRGPDLHEPSKRLHQGPGAAWHRGCVPPRLQQERIIP